MADSNITKKALAAALKELMEKIPFEKISVSQICEMCGMNRKSFYYHFKDKYDLVNWIFDREVQELFPQGPAIQENWDEQWSSLEILSRYFYENRSFYRKVLKIKGQNSFAEHFQDFLHPFLEARLTRFEDKDQLNPFVLNFFLGACVFVLMNWLKEPDCMPPEQFSELLKSTIRTVGIVLYKEMGTADFSPANESSGHLPTQI